MSCEFMQPHVAQRHLTVPFDLPHMEFVHTAQLRPLDHAAVDSSAQAPIAINQPLPMQLLITHTRQWDLDREPGAMPEYMAFQYEVQASPDTWLIGGQRKARFSAKV